MVRIIVQIPNDNRPASQTASEHLRSAATDLGCRWLSDLRSQLGVFGIRNGDFVYGLPYIYHLLEPLDNDAFSAAARIVRFHNDPSSQRYPHGYVDHVEVDRDLWVAVPATAFGANFALGGHHNHYMSQLQIANAHARTKGAGARIAIVDSGYAGTLTVASFHDLVTANASGQSDPTGHGTAMATIIHAVAEDAEIHVIRVTDSNGKAKLWDVMAGMSTAVFDCKAHVINLSLGFPHMASNCGTCGVSGQNRSKAFEGLLKGLFTLKVSDPLPPPSPIVVAATGNGGSSQSMDYPAAFSDTTLAVGALTSGYVRSSFSNYGTPKDLYMMLPGGDETPDHKGSPKEWIGSATSANGSTTYCLGTSPATAYAASLVALYWADNNFTLSAKALIDTLLQRCDRNYQSYNQVEHGSGRLYFH